ncbi:TPA: transposase, partial [Pseudomonas aeruginosa]|nr:transposase [Pseudomonas aeruginosa]
MKKRFTEEQILDFLKQAEAGVPVKELCRRRRDGAVSRL